jgi:F0F1-type ATP synthase epsilon subunit
MQPTDLRQKPLNLIVRTPEKTIYQGEAKAVSSVNERGPFDVLGAHQNFITLIKESLIIIDPQGEKQDVPIQDGVMRVHENEVTIFLGVTTLKEE